MIKIYKPQSSQGMCKIYKEFKNLHREPQSSHGVQLRRTSVLVFNRNENKKSYEKEGSLITTVVPFPTCDARLIVPEWFWMILFTSGSPIPLPGKVPELAPR